MKTKISFKLLSAIMALMLMFGVFAPTVNAAVETDFTSDDQAGVYDYVSIGASNTNGYGHRGYLPGEVTEDPLAATKAGMNTYGYLRAPKNAYPALIAESLEKQLDTDVELHQLAISSMRVEELRVLLDNKYYGDAYTEWRFTGGQNWFGIAKEGGLKALRKEYQDYVKNAELITIDMGWNNFGVYAFNNIKTILADGNYWKAPDFSQLDGADEKVGYASIKKMALDYLKTELNTDDPAMLAKVNMMADVLAYAAIGSCYHFDIVMDKIYKLNPDVTVVVINIQNLADDLEVDFNGKKLNLGDLYGELIGLVDDYRRSESPYADKYMFANAGDVDTYLDDIVAWDGDPATLTDDMKDCFDMYDDSLYVRSIVEYLMIGQALSQLFAGFRDLGAGYGLDVFKNDAKYTYEFGLTRTPEQLLSLDLAKLDLKNPSGPDADVEAYGAAVAEHLKNLRHFEEGKNAYDYIFEDLVSNLEAQRASLLAMVEGVPEEYYPAELKAGLAQIDQAINVIIPTAKAEFANKLNAIHTTYVNTLNYAYDVVATFVQYAAQINTVKIDVNSLNGFNSVTKTLMGTIVNDFINGAMNKFNYELYANGLSANVAAPVPEYDLDESIFDDSALAAIAVLAVRYELGNSFYAHPSVEGNKQIRDAVLLAMARGTSAKEDCEGDFLRPWSWLMDYTAKNNPEAHEVIKNVALYVRSEEFKVISKELEKIYNKVESATTTEQKAKLAKETYELVSRLMDVAAKATNKKLDLSQIEYYVSLGDSTITGYGLSEYIDGVQNGAGQVVKNSAHVVLAQKLFGDNWKSQFANYCQGSLRADDLLLLLGGEVELDDYYYAEIEPNLTVWGGLESAQEEFIGNVKDADLITVAVGGGNFLTFAGKYVNRVMGTTPGGAYELDWSRVGIDENSIDMKNLEKDLDAMVSIIDGLGLLDEYIPEGMEIEDPAKFARALAEGLIYGYISYTYYYTKVLDRIREINPDAQVVVLGMFNPVDNWTMTVEIDGKETGINIGGLLGLMLESANAQALATALLDDNITYVSTRDAETILESEKPGEKLGFNDYYNSSFKSNGKAVHASVNGHKYIAEQIYTAITVEYTKEEIAKEAINVFAKYGKFIEDEFGEDISAGLDEAIENLVILGGYLSALVAEYYDEGYAYAYEVLKANGVIDELAAQLAAAKAELEALRADLAGMGISGEYGALVNELIEELDLTILTADKVLELLNHSAITSETWQLLGALCDDLVAHGYNIIDIATEIGEIGADHTSELINAIVAEAEVLAKELYAKALEEIAALKAELEAKIAELTAEAEKQIAALKAEAAAKIAELEEQLKTAVGAAKEAIEAEIARIEAELAVAIEAIKADLAVYVETLKAETAKKIAEIEAKLQEDILALNAYVQEQIKAAELAAEAFVAEVLYQVEKAAVALKAEAEAKIAELRLEVEAQIKALTEAAEAEIAALIAATEAEIAILIREAGKKIAELEKQLEIAAGASREAILAEIARVNAELEATIAALNAALNNSIASIRAELNVQIEALKAGLDAEIAKINAALKAELQALNNSVKELLNGVYAAFDLEGLVASAKKAAAELKAKAEAEIAALVAEAEAKIVALRAIAEAQIEALKAATAAEIAALIAEFGSRIAELEAELKNASGEAAEAIRAEIAALQAELAARIAALEAALDEGILALQAELERQIAEINATLNAQIAAIEKALAEGLDAIQLGVLAVLAEVSKHVDISPIIAEIEKAAAALRAEADAKIAELVAQAQAQIDALTAAANAKIAELTAQAQAEIAALKAAAAAKIAELEEQLKTAVGAVQEAIKAEIARIEAELEAAIAEVEAELAATIAAIEAELQAQIKAIEAELAASIAQVEAELNKALNELNNRIYEQLDAMKLNAELFLNDLIAKAEAAAEQLTAQAEAKIQAIIDELNAQIAALEAAAKAEIDAAIAEVEAQIEALKAEAAERIAELEEQLKTAVGAAKEAIEAEIARIEAELNAAIAALEAELAATIAAIEAELNAQIKALIERGDLEIEAIRAALNEQLANLNKVINTYINALKTESEIVKANVEALKKAVEELKGVVEALLGDIIAETEGYIAAALADVYDAFVKAVMEAVKKYGPEAAEWAYNWLIENADEIIGFFYEYGDEINEFFAKYGEEIFVVLHYIVTYYGEAVANFIMDNADVILPALCDLVKEYGDDALRFMGMLIYDLIIEYHDEAYEQAYEELEKAGIIEAIILELLNQQAKIEEYQRQLDAMEVEEQYVVLRDLLAAELNLMKFNLDQMIELMGHDTLNAETWALLKELRESITEHGEIVTEIANEISNIGTAHIENLIYNVNATVEQAIADLQAAAEQAIADLKASAEQTVANIKAQAEQAIAAIKAQTERQLAILNKQLETAVGEAKAEIEAEIARLQAQLEAQIKAINDALEAQIKAINDALEAQINAITAQLDAQIAALKAEAVAKITELQIQLAVLYTNVKILNSTVENLIYNANKLVGTLKDIAEKYLEIDAEEVFNQFVKDVVDTVAEQIPEAADWIYNWVLNNPEKVIAFFEEYGDDMVEFCVKYQKEIFVVIGFIVDNFGDDVVEYVLDNADVILSALVYVVETYGEDALKLIRAYLEVIAENIKNQIENDPEAFINSFVKVVMLIGELAGKVVDGAIDILDELGLTKEIEKALAELEAGLYEAAKARIEAIVAEVEARIAALEAAIAEQVEAIIAEAEAQIDALKAQAKAQIAIVIAKAEAKIQELNAQAEAQLAILYAKLETAVGEARERIIAEIARIEAELEAAIYEINAAVEAKIAEIEAKVAAEIARLQAQAEAQIAAINAALEAQVAAMKSALEAKIAEIEAQIKAAVENAATTLIESVKYFVVNELADIALDILREYGPDVAEFVYEWIKNNPDKVYDFFVEYGDDIYNFLNDHSEEIAKIIKFIIDNYGEEIAEYVLDNADVILAALVDWIKVYGPDALELIKVYLDTLDISFNLGDIMNNEAVIEAFTKIVYLVKNLGDMIYDGVYDYVDALNLVGKIELALAELKAYLVDSINEKIAEIKGYVDAKIEEIKAEIQAQIDALVADFNAKVEAIKAEIEAKIAALKAELENAIGEAKARIEAEIARLEAIRDAEIARLEAQLQAYIAALQAELEARIEAALDELDQQIIKLQQAVKVAIKDAADNIYGVVEDFVDDAVTGKYNPTEDSYYVSVSSGNAHYAQLLAEALDFNLGYALRQNAGQLGLTTWGDIDYNMLAKADLVTIGYDDNDITDFAVNQLVGYIANYVDGTLRNNTIVYAAGVLAAMQNSGINVEDYEMIASLMIEMAFDEILANELIAGRTMQEMDWAAVVGEENVHLVDQARESIRAEILANGISETLTFSVPVLDLIYEYADMANDPDISAALETFDKSFFEGILGESANYTVEIPLVDALVFAAESYLYSYASFNVTYGKLIFDLYEINPEATVVLLGHHNAFSSVAVDLGGVNIDLGEAYSIVSNVYSVQAYTYALLSPNVAYVDISDAETVYESYVRTGVVENDILTFLMLYLEDSNITDVSEDGHAYICEQILKTLTIGCNHKYDNACDAYCNKCGEYREVPGHIYDSPCDKDCNVCGEIRNVPGHIYSGCNDATCNVCGDKRQAPGHQYTDCTDMYCNVCGELRTDDIYGHVYDGCHDTECNLCGATRPAGEHAFDHCLDTTCYKCDYVRDINGLAHEYDSCTDTTCNVCGRDRLAVEHVYTDCTDTDCNLCGEIREAGKHDYTGCEDAECNLCGATREPEKHTINKCTDGVCSVCGEAVEVTEGHKWGEWTVVVEATRKAAGEKSRTCSKCDAVQTVSIDPIDGLSAGAIVAIVIGSVVVAGAAGFAIYWFIIQKKTFAALLAVITGSSAAEAGAAGAAAAEAGAEGAEAAEAGAEANAEAEPAEAPEANQEETK